MTDTKQVTTWLSDMDGVLCTYRATRVVDSVADVVGWVGVDACLD